MVVAGSILAMPASAKREGKPYFITCDGFLTPLPLKASGDTPQRFAFGRSVWPPIVPTVAYRAEGVAACDQALADPLLAPQYWDRKLSLVQARAIHLLAAKKSREALDAFDAVAKLSGFTSSLGQGNNVLRAIAFYQMSKPFEADALLMKAAAARPYARNMRKAIHSVRLTFEQSAEKREQALRDEVVLNPGFLRMLFYRAIADGRLEQALVYGNQVSFDLPRNRSGWSLEGIETRNYDLIRDRASMSGARAYALSGLGRGEASTTELADARREISEAVAPPAEPKDMEFIGKTKRRDWEKRVAAGEEAEKALGEWEAAIAYRTKAARLTPMELAEAADRPKGEAVIATGDLLRLTGGTSEQDKAMREAGRKVIQAEIDKMIATSLKLTYSSIASDLPGLENGKPKMRGEGSNFWRTDMEGYAIVKADDPALFNVRFGGLSARANALSEAALLVAADEAMRRGFDALVIESSLAVDRFTIVNNGPKIPSGTEVRMLVRPVRQGALPASLAGGEWRVLKVTDIRAQLAAKYPPQS
jgi:tetratricopeptide (TPR) repeat protein